MDTPRSRPVLDVRSLPSTEEVVVCQDGGLFPVLDTAVDGTMIAIFRGGAGHVGIGGRIEMSRSKDGGQNWSPPAIIADTDADDRNPAFGVSTKGTLVLAYVECTSYDEDGRWTREPSSEGAFPWRFKVIRSHDGGLTWEKPFPVDTGVPESLSPYGKIISLDDGGLLMPFYAHNDRPAGTDAQGVSDSVYTLRSRDDGLTWTDPTLLAHGMNETGLLALPGGDILAVMRSADEGALLGTRSGDGGHTWTDPERITGSSEHPADVVLLANGAILLTYGNRNPPYRVEGLVSRDGGRSWLDGLLTFSGHLYGYTVDAPRRYDLGYPSSAIRRSDGSGEGVTMYYYATALDEAPTYAAQNYYAIAVTWDEQELIDAVDKFTKG